MVLATFIIKCLLGIHLNCKQVLPFPSRGRSMGASTVSGGPTTECLQGAHEALTRADAGVWKMMKQLGMIIWALFATGRWAENTTLLRSKFRITHTVSAHVHSSSAAWVKAILGAFQGFLEVPRFSQTLHTPVPLEPLPSDQHVFGVFWDIFLCKDSSLPASYTAFVCNPARSQVIFPTCEDCPAGLPCLAFINLGDS